MLRACRRLLRRGGRLAFLTILITDDLTLPQQRRAVRAGPPAVHARRDHRTLLQSAGFAGVEETDVTADYLTTVRSWSDESSAREVELRTVLGDELFSDRQNDRQAQASAIEQGLLRRSLFVARID